LLERLLARSRLSLVPFPCLCRSPRGPRTPHLLARTPKSPPRPSACSVGTDRGPDRSPEWSPRSCRLAGTFPEAPSASLLGTVNASCAFLRPRFEALGGDLDRLQELYVDVRDGAVSFPSDLPELEEIVRETKTRMLIVDPVSASLDLRLDSHKDSHVRIVLGRLANPLQDMDVEATVAATPVLRYKIEIPFVPEDAGLRHRLRRIQDRGECPRHRAPIKWEVVSLRVRSLRYDWARRPSCPTELRPLMP
jgi:hypothetical protein